MNKSDIFWQSYLSLEKEAIEVSKYIYITDAITVCGNGVENEQPYKSQLETFSPHIAAGNFENVGYARSGKEGLYNILIMEE